MTRSDIIDLAEGCGEKPVAVATQFARKEPAARRYLLDHYSGMLAAARGMTARRGALAVAQIVRPHVACWSEATRLAHSLMNWWRP